MTHMPLPNPNDPAVLARHQYFLRTRPQFALALRELIESGWSKAHVLEILRRGGLQPWFVEDAGIEIDYLLATGAAGRSLRAAPAVTVDADMSADMPAAV
ncbi:MAG: hypothetical protein IT318_24660 [Anaerolineales bacterium]|nr:hypothetical protein [Anaerolineales bacterium]